MAALDHLFDRILHVVAQVVEAQLVVGRIRHIAGISLAASVVIHTGDNRADGQTKEIIDSAHPLRIPRGEIVIHRNDVNAASREGIEIGGQGGDKGLTFTRFHLGNVTGVEDIAAEELHFEGTKTECPFCGFSHHRKRLIHQII